MKSALNNWKRIATLFILMFTISVTSSVPSVVTSGSSKFNPSVVSSSVFLTETILPSTQGGLDTVGVGVLGPAFTVDTGVFRLVVVVLAVEMTAWGVWGLETIGMGVGT